MNALDLISSEPVKPQSIAKAKLILKATFGVDQEDAKLALLFDMMREEGWSDERFQITLKWFLKNKPWPAWTIADWFQYSVKLYPIEWAQKKWTQGYKTGSDIWRWKLPDGSIAYSEPFVDLPFELQNTVPKASA